MVVATDADIDEFHRIGRVGAQRMDTTGVGGKSLPGRERMPVEGPVSAQKKMQVSHFRIDAVFHAFIRRGVFLAAFA